jgi:6-phosphofructokinase
MEKGMRIAINTGGGDAPGLNAVIQSVVWPQTAGGGIHTASRTDYAGLLKYGRNNFPYA